MIWDRIYRRNLWRGEESHSGPGSGSVPTLKIASWLVELAERLEIESTLDVGCGDGFWIPELPGYLGIDPSSVAITRARERHPTRSFGVGEGRDLLGLPPFDLVILRDVLQHLSLGDGLSVLRAVQLNGARYLVASTYTGPSERHGDPVNVDIASGESAYSPDLVAAPFHLPHPLDVIPDGWDYAEPGVLRDRAKWLGLWDVAILDPIGEPSS